MTPAVSLALPLVKEFEGFRTDPYQDTGGYWTIGYGSRFLANGSPVTKESPSITQDDAEQIALDNLLVLDTAISSMVQVSLNDNQMAALLDFTYNLGPDRLRSSTLLRVLNQGQYNAARIEILRWNKSTVNGKLVPLMGLTARRRAEYTLWGG